ncbi:MAG: DUF4105 domain-containing protein [Gemmatimonadales bacterium]|nr:MAG: DUF4105 domain-containing protein [Gemmatimonadales bacterium]
MLRFRPVLSARHPGPLRRPGFPACMALLILLVLLPARGAAAQDDPFADGPLQVWLLTMDRGDEVYEMFGHNALLIRDERTGEELAWNWGLFNFEDVDFIPRFLRGTMRYSMGPAEPEPFLRTYAATNRAVYANRIHLTQAEAAELDAFVRWNYLPENRPYVYDYYRDNCSTRLRDALDLVLGGQIAARFQDRPTGRTYRWFSRELVQVTGWVDQGLSFLLGMRGDVPISEWESMFLPVELMQYLEGFSVEEPGGGTRPLLGPRQLVVEATRDPLPAGPPGPSVGFLLVGLLLGGAMVGLAVAAAPRASAPGTGRSVAPAAGSEPTAASMGRVPGWPVTGAPRRRLPRILLGAMVFAWGSFSGLLGLLLVAAWFTDHVFIQANLNIFQMSPLALVGALLVPGFLLMPAGPARERVGRGAVVVTAVILALAIVAVLLQGVGVLFQRNVDVVFLALPLNLGMAVAAWRVTGGLSTFRRLPAHS